MAELVGAAVIVLLVAGVLRQAGRSSRAVFVAGLLATVAALALLAPVAFVLSINQP